MRRILLDGDWTLHFDGHTLEKAQVPGSVYSALLDAGLMEDPFYRDNELKALALMDKDCEYELKFTFDPMTVGDADGIFRKVLVFEGIDTLADILLNGFLLASVDNMHRTWRLDATELLKEGENCLKVIIHSPVRYIKEANKEVYCGGTSDAIEGYPHLRKAHCMFGWDWGPRLPDMGIFRSVYIALEPAAVLDSVYISQAHTRNADGTSDVTLTLSPEIRYNDSSCAAGSNDSGSSRISLLTTVTCPDGSTISTDSDTVTIKNASLWWPNGYGSQPLYTVTAALMDEESGRIIDSWTRRIGLRTMTVNTDPDQWGRRFAHEVNGVCIFAMGADYIPEDNILSRITPERTRKLLTDAAKAHHNSIRVWGGGYYPDDFFYDICDELGLVVWQDCMFACASYELDPAFDANIRAEIADNVRRIRHHASLGLWCGNNEMETQTLDGCWKPSIKQKADYLRIFEYIIPQVIREEDPDTFYWPSSPSSGGNFDNPWDEGRGDAHYWDVWHGSKPYTDYRKYFFRYLSEFGFQSFPNIETVKSFTLPEDRNIFSRIMEMHQRNVAANGKLANYLSATYLYPYSFERFIYLSQLMQADAIRYGVEHFRRNRGRCMGAVVWQLNDIWPVASWSSIDYYGRPKALHYAEAKMFNPVMISCEEHGQLDQKPFCVSEPKPVDYSFRLSVCNETMSEVSGTVRWKLCDPEGRTISMPAAGKGHRSAAASLIPAEGSDRIRIPALSTFTLDSVDCNFIDPFENYLYYEFIPDSPVADKSGCSGTSLFAAPKHFRFAEPHVKAERSGSRLRVSTDVFTKSLCIEGKDSYVRLSDNYFDLQPGSIELEIVEGDAEEFIISTVNRE